MDYFSERYGSTYISFAEAERRTGRSRDELLEAIRKREIRGVEIGSALFIDATSLDKKPQESSHEHHAHTTDTSRTAEDRISDHADRGNDREEQSAPASGPGRFVFEWRDALSATPLLVITLAALFLAAPTYNDRGGAASAQIADAFFPGNPMPESPSVALADPTRDAEPAEAVPAAPPESRAHAPDELHDDRPILANALAGSADVLRSIARFLYDTFGIFEQE